MSDIQLVVFDVGGQVFGAETEQVFQIIKYQETTKVPRMPRFLEGIITYRDTFIPVVNLVKRFDMGELMVSKKTKILVTQLGDKYAGFIVNDVSEILRISDNEIEASPAILGSDVSAYLKKVAIKGDTLISIIDLEKVLNDNEVKRLSKVVKKAEAEAGAEAEAKAKAKAKAEAEA